MCFLKWLQFFWTVPFFEMVNDAIKLFIPCILWYYIWTVFRHISVLKQKSMYECKKYSFFDFWEFQNDCSVMHLVPGHCMFLLHTFRNASSVKPIFHSSVGLPHRSFLWRTLSVLQYCVLIVKPSRTFSTSLSSMWRGWPNRIKKFSLHKDICSLRLLSLISFLSWLYTKPEILGIIIGKNSIISFWFLWAVSIASVLVLVQPPCCVSFSLSFATLYHLCGFLHLSFSW